MISILNQIKADIKTDIHKADEKIDLIYELYKMGKLNLTESEKEYMFLLIDRISNILYHKIPNC